MTQTRTYMPPRTRTFTLPNTGDERRRLVDEITAAAIRLLGVARPANVAGWLALDMASLRRVHANWLRECANRKARPSDQRQLPESGEGRYA